MDRIDNISMRRSEKQGKCMCYTAYLQPCVCVLQVLVVCPTQELCMQVLRVARALLPEAPQCAQPAVGEALRASWCWQAGGVSIHADVNA